MPGPSLISGLIYKAVTARRPRTRYHVGYMSGMLLTLRNILPDRWFDAVIMSQFR